MRQRIACADFTFPLLPHDQSLNLIAMLGFDGVDIGLFEKRSHLWPSREFEDVSRSARALVRKVKACGLTVADIFLQMDPDFSPYAINHPVAARRRKARDWFSRTLEYAAEVGCLHVTCLPGARFQEETAKVSRGRAAEELAWRVALASSHGIVLGVEAHLGSIVPSPAAASRLIGDVSGLTLTLDYSHFARKGIPDAEVEPLIRDASHFHVRGARKGRLQCSFKDNTIDYGRILGTMRRTGYTGYVGIEYVWTEWERCNEVDNLSETVLFRDFVWENQGGGNEAAQGR